MTPDQSALVVAIFAFLGVIASPIIAGFLADQQDKRKERQALLISQMDRLLAARSDYIAADLTEKRLYDPKNPASGLEYAAKRAFALSQAYGACYATADSTLVKMVDEIMIAGSLKPEEFLNNSIKHLGLLILDQNKTRYE